MAKSILNCTINVMHLDFSIVNYPYLSGNIPPKESYGVFVSQLIRCARCCMSAVDFISRTKILVRKLTNQGFKKPRLRRVFEKFAANYYELLFKYNKSLKYLLHCCWSKDKWWVVLDYAGTTEHISCFGVTPTIEICQYNRFQ